MLKVSLVALILATIVPLLSCDSQAAETQELPDKATLTTLEARIAELEAEIARLRTENSQLRAKLAERHPNADPLTPDADKDSATASSAPSTEKLPSSSASKSLSISGTIFDEENKPVENVKVYLCHKKAGAIILDVSREPGGPLTINNPVGGTDAKGQFRIDTTFEFLKTAPQRLGLRAPEDKSNTFDPGYTLAVILPDKPGEFKVLGNADDEKYLWFMVDQKNQHLDLKTFNLHDASNPPTWVFRYPSGDFKVGGTFVVDHKQ